MRRGTRWSTRKGLVWGLALVTVGVGGVAAAGAAPADGTKALPAVAPAGGDAVKESNFFVDVIGPGFAQPGNECLFRAVPKSPAVWPYSFQWSPPASGTDDFAYAIMPSGVSSVVVSVDVWDANDVHSSGFIEVQLDPSNDPCGI